VSRRRPGRDVGETDCPHMTFTKRCGSDHLERLPDRDSLGAIRQLSCRRQWIPEPNVYAGGEHLNLVGPRARTI
jgi:hypothetical protein